MSNQSFTTLNLHPDTLQNLVTLGYENMTPIQTQSLPAILDGKDVIAQGQTGSGKTAAFALGILHKLDVTSYKVQSLVLCPTRELADQVAKEIRRVGRAIPNVKVLTLCGGMPFKPQLDSLEFGAHIIVGTPGRVEEHLRRGGLSLDELNTFVLDEADRMLEMGFQPSLEAIVEQIPQERQTLLFSATYPEGIARIARTILKSPVRVTVESTHSNVTIEQHFYKVRDEAQRLSTLKLVINAYGQESIVVFCNTKVDTQMVADALTDEGLSVLALNGDLEQKDRDQVLARFANKSVTVLVATDVAARGLDIDGLDLVVNFHVARDEEVYVHRIGRTGRAGSRGVACSLFSEKEAYKIGLLGDYLGVRIEGESVGILEKAPKKTLKPNMVTLQIDAGKKQKLRPGDILGALTGDGGILGAQVGKIQMFDFRAYVAVQKNVAIEALAKLQTGKMKGRNYRVWLVKS